MFGDNGPVIDLDRAAEAVSQAEVLVIGFDFTQDRMLIDLREDPEGRTPPLVELVEPLGSATERTMWLQDRRPEVAPPERFIFMGWPHTTEFLDDVALLEVIARRLKTEQGIDPSDDLAAIIRELRRRERLDARSAVTGAEGFETVWSRSGR